MSKDCIETIRIDDGVIYNLLAHQKRLNYTQKSLWDNYSSIILSDLIKAPKSGLYRCRVLYNRDIESIEYIPYRRRKITSLECISSDIDYSFKYKNRDELNALLNRTSCDEVIIIKDGLITDTTISNIAFLKDNIWITPKKPLLKGTAREFLLENGLLSLADIKPQDIDSFSRVAIFNAMIGFQILENNVTIRR